MLLIPPRVWGGPGAPVGAEVGDSLFLTSLPRCPSLWCASANTQDENGFPAASGRPALGTGELEGSGS